jgi:TolB-like protein
LILPVRKSAALRRAYLLAAVSLFVLLTGSIGLWFYFSVNGKTSIKDARLVPAPEIKSLAVLPFKPLDAGDNYLGLGIADAMIRRISQTGRLIVRPTSAVRRYLNKETDAIAAARELEVDAVIEGAVQRVGDRIRVSINLLRTSDGASLWADRFDIGSADIFTIQDRMAQQVAAHLQLRLDSAQQGVSPSVTPLTQSPTNIT